MDIFRDVYDFNVKFELLAPGYGRVQHLTLRKLDERIGFLQEELDEFKRAAEAQDMPKMFDALLDLVYVAMGTAVHMGLPWHEGWAEVQRSNMEKVKGMTKRNHGKDVMKPEGWVGPRLHAVLADYGYSFSDWTAPGGLVVDESKCVDDEL